MSGQKFPKKKNTLKNVAVLSGIAFQMGAIIFLAAKGGSWLDQHYGNEKRVFTAISTIFGVAVSIWVVLRQLKRIEY